MEQRLGRPRLALIIPLLVASLLFGCAAPGPELERFDPNATAWVAIGPMSIESMAVERAGDTVRTTAVFVQGQDRVTLTFEMFLEPPARFVEGSQISTIGGKPFAGPVSAESVDFFGGQNEGSSVGGVFVFENPASGVRYRLSFPPTRPPAAPRVKP